MFLTLSLPITLTSIILYLFLTFLGNNNWVWGSGLILSILISTFLLKNYFKTFLFKKYLDVKFLSLIFLILFFVFIKAFVLSPFAQIKQTNNFKHLQVTDVGDYYKHTFVVTMLKLDGIPPYHPYFPVGKLSYYFGYYLIPAAISRIFNFPPNQVFYAFCLITDFLGLLIIFRIFNRQLSSYFGKLLSLLLLFSAVGVNVLPELFKIPLNVFSTDLGFQLINNYVSFLFVPQHFFAANLTLGLIYYLIFEKPKIIFISITAGFIFLSSLFVSWTLALWLLLIFIFYPKIRKLLIISGFFSLLILIPYMLQLSDRENIFRVNQLQPYLFMDGSGFLARLINILLTAFLQYGLIVFTVFVLVIFKGKTYFKNNLVLCLGLTLPFVITWFIRSPYFNDFSLRGLMPIQLILPVFFIKFYEQIKNQLLKMSLFLISILVILLGFAGFYREYLGHWKTRFILHPNISQFLFEVRKIPDSTRLAAVDRDRWVEFIPSLGFKKVLSPYFFDSYVYFVGNLSADHGQYERMALDLFIEANVAPDLKTLIKDKNTQLNKLYEFFNKYPSDQLILNNQLWVKKDVNPWLAIFKAMQVKTKPLTGSFTLVDYKDLLNKTSQHQIFVEIKVLEIPVKNRAITLKGGFWYLASCSNIKRTLKLELEDYYQLFEQEVDGNNKGCVGKMFYLQNDENVALTNTSTVDRVYSFPIVINKI